MSVCINKRAKRKTSQCISKNDEITLDDIARIVITLNNKIMKLRDEIAGMKNENFSNNNCSETDKKFKVYPTFISLKEERNHRGTKGYSVPGGSCAFRKPELGYCVTHEQVKNRGKFPCESNTAEIYSCSKTVRNEKECDLQPAIVTKGEQISKEIVCCNCSCPAIKKVKKISRGVQCDAKVKNKKPVTCLKCCNIWRSRRKQRNKSGKTGIEVSEESPESNSSKNGEVRSETDSERKIRIPGKEVTFGTAEGKLRDSEKEKSNSKQNQEFPDRLGGGADHKKGFINTYWINKVKDLFSVPNLPSNASKLKKRLNGYVMKLDDMMKEVSASFPNPSSTKGNKLEQTEKTVK